MKDFSEIQLWKIELQLIQNYKKKIIKAQLEIRRSQIAHRMGRIRKRLKKTLCKKIKNQLNETIFDYDHLTVDFLNNFLIEVFF